MARRFLVKDIALQAGVGPATVDRVLNGRSGVRRQTAERVLHAIAELEQQAGQLALSGRKLIIDVIVEAPLAFLDELETAIALELPLMRLAVFRVRKDLRARFSVEEIDAALRRVARRGSQGVILMAPDSVFLHRTIAELEDTGTPVVTLATDLPGSRRKAYVGLDNRRAGATAAWFIRRLAGAIAAPRVIVTIRNEHFRGEEERQAGFRAALLSDFPDASLEVLVEGKEWPDFAQRVASVVSARPAVAAIYSIGGGNRRILATLEAAGVPRPLFIAHDFDPDNRGLLGDGRIDVLLYHDLREDIRNAFRAILSARGNGAIPAPPDGAALKILVPPMVA